MRFLVFFTDAHTIISIVVIPTADIFIASLPINRSNLRRLVTGGPGVPNFSTEGAEIRQKIPFAPKVARSNELTYTDKDTIRP